MTIIQIKFNKIQHKLLVCAVLLFNSLNLHAQKKIKFNVDSIKTRYSLSIPLPFPNSIYFGYYPKLSNSNMFIEVGIIPFLHMNNWSDFENLTVFKTPLAIASIFNYRIFSPKVKHVSGFGNGFYFVTGFLYNFDRTYVVENSFVVRAALHEALFVGLRYEQKILENLYFGVVIRSSILLTTVSKKFHLNQTLFGFGLSLNIAEPFTHKKWKTRNTF